jgi:hypothetical protein
MSHRSCLVPLALSLVLTSAGAAWADSGGGWQSWVNALTPEQLCAAYLNDIISDEDLPGRAGIRSLPAGCQSRGLPLVRPERRLDHPPLNCRS